MTQQANTLYNLVTLVFVVLTGLVILATVAIAVGVFDSPLFAAEANDSPPTVRVPDTVSPLPGETAIAAGDAMSTPDTGTLTPTSTPEMAATAPEPVVATAAEVMPSLAPSATRTPLPTRGSTGPSPTPTATPTWTPSPSLSPAPLGPTFTPTPELPFILQPGTPILRSNFANADGCNWQGIAGTIIDTQANHITGVRVVVSGDSIGERAVISGTNPFYGDSGWEVALGSEVNTEGFIVRLVGDDGVPLSPTATIIFPGACEQNLALVNFVQIRPY